MRQLDGKITGRANQKILYGSQAYLLLFFAIIGLGFVHFSESGGSFRISDFSGMLIVLLAALLDAINIDRSLKFGEVQASSSTTDQRNATKPLVYCIFSVAVTNFVTGVVVCLIILIQVILGGNSISSYFELSNVSFIVIYTLVGVPLMLIYLRKANLSTIALEINSIRYVTPLLALLWLVIFSDVSIARPDIFVAGTVVVLATNMILHAKNQTNSDINKERDRLGLTALVLAMWTVGVIVLYRDRILGSWLDEWQWSGSTDYFAMLGLSTTVFILMLSFRTLRLMESRRTEDQMTFSLYWKVWALKGRYSQTNELELIKEIDTSIPGKSLDEKKTAIHKTLESKIESLTELEQAKLLEELDYLVHSKSHGRDIIEPMVLVLFAMMTTLIVLTTRPYFDGWNGFIIDVFAILFASTIVFLTINLFEQRRDRTSSIFKSSSETANSWIDIWLPIGVCAMLTISYISLLYGKWLSDWSWAKELFA